MAKRRDPGQKEFNPLDDVPGRLPIDDELIRAVVSGNVSGNVLGPVSGPVSDTAPGPHLQPAASVMARSIEEPRLEEFRREERLPGKGIALEKLTAYNKYLTTQTEKFELERLTARVSGALGASVKPSQVIRACLVLILRAENEIIRRAEKQPRVKRPSNTEAVALAEFDQTLAEILSQAFRDAGPLRNRQ